MLKNYLKIALRNLLKRRGYTLINVMGLAVGIACCWLILVFVQDGLRYDRFHEKADRIYRATVHGHMAENDVTAANSPAPMAATLAAEYPEVVVAARIKQPDNTVLVSHGESKFNEQKVYFADSTFFEVFTFPLVMGDPKAALRKPFSIVVTEDVARKYFDRENPLGKVLVLNNDESYKVTGVVRNLPYQTHFRFDFLASFNSWDISRSTAWTSNHLYTYLVLQENYPAERLAAKFPSLVGKYLGPQMEEGMGVTYDQFVASGGIIEYSRQPLTEIHLHSHLAGELEPNSGVNYVTIFSLIAFFILLLACINFMNLANGIRVCGRLDGLAAIVWRGARCGIAGWKLSRIFPGGVSTHRRFEKRPKHGEPRPRFVAKDIGRCAVCHFDCADDRRFRRASSIAIRPREAVGFRQSARGFAPPC